MPERHAEMRMEDMGVYEGREKEGMEEKGSRDLSCMTSLWSVRAEEIRILRN